MSDSVIDLADTGLAVASLAVDPTRTAATALALKQLKRISTPDRRAQEGWVEILQDIPLENAMRIADLEARFARVVEALTSGEPWSDVPVADRPVPDDVLARLKSLGSAWRTSGGHGKRKMLFNAFFSSFKPEFYTNGMASHLWRIAEQLEYPETRLLADTIQWQHTQDRSPANHPGKAELGSVIEFLGAKLEVLGLARLEGAGARVRIVAPTEMGRRLRRFVWDDSMWDLDVEL